MTGFLAGRSACRQTSHEAVSDVCREIHQEPMVSIRYGLETNHERFLVLGYVKGMALAAVVYRSKAGFSGEFRFGLIA